MGALRTFAGTLRARVSLWVGGATVFPGAKGRGPRDVEGRLTTDHKDMLSQLHHEEILSACRHIYNSFPMVVGAVDDKASAVVGNGWSPEFDGQDLAWGEAAEDYLKDLFEYCDVRGSPYTNRVLQRIGSITLDRDGEYFVHYVKTALGPQKQMLESHRIGSRYHNSGYQSYQVRNGIAYDAQGRPVAYHFLGETKEQDRWIPAKDIDHVFDPKWFSQGRGISPLVFGILDWLDVSKTRDSEKVAQRMFAMLALKHKNKTGKPSGHTTRYSKELNANVVDETESTELVEEMKSGTIEYLRINSEELEPFTGARPTVDQRAFEESVLRGAFAGLGWSFEQSIDSSRLSGNSSRRDINKNQRSADQRSMILAYGWGRYTSWAVTVAMQAGVLPFSEEWSKFIPQLPARMTADPGNESKIELEEMRFGGRSLKNFSGNRGRHWRDLRQDLENEGDDLMKRAKRLHDSHPEFPLAFCATLISMRTPNGNELNAQDEDKSSQNTDQKNKESAT